MSMLPFRILPKEKIGLIGANGVGKTTLIEILGGKIIPDGGRIEFAPSNQSRLFGSAS
jgi:ATPase subunit of ABC transporter with duplicated ATPase domains